MKRIRLLHIVSDDKFIDGPLNHFEKDGRFENKAILIVDSPDYKIRLIKNTDKIELIYSKKMVKETLRRDDYDAILFYSLTDYHIFRYIPNNIIVIWWAWGYDLYGPDRFIDIPLYKPMTKVYLNRINSSLLDRAKLLLKKCPIVFYLRDGSRKKAIRRLDYFQPVIHLEYELMKKVKDFDAKEFYYPQAHNHEESFKDGKPTHEGNVLIGNSATYTNNHLDVWADVKEFLPLKARVYFPLNYGINDYADYLEKEIKGKHQNVFFLRSFLAKDEYYNLLDSCSYAIFGNIREQAMGNIYRCLAKGIKVFLYKDSIPYQYFLNLGCNIFSIEDITKDSFETPLTAEQSNNNIKCLMDEREKVNNIREKAIVEILDRVNSRDNLD